MPKTAKRNTVRKTAKPRPRDTMPANGNPPEDEPVVRHVARRDSIEDPLVDIEDDGIDQDAWLIEREAGDIQRDDH